MVRKGERACGRQLECVDHRGEQLVTPFGRLVPSMAAETAEADIPEGPKRSSKGLLSFLRDFSPFFSSFIFILPRLLPPQPTRNPYCSQFLPRSVLLFYMVMNPSN